MEIIALKAAMTLPILLLQKPHRTSKVKEHNKCIECRLSLWLDGALLDEGHTIQCYLHPRIKNMRISAIALKRTRIYINNYEQ